MVFNKNYSKWIRPILYGIDLCIILISTYFFLTKDSKNISVFLFLWVVLSIFFSFYKIYRFTKIVKIVTLLLKQAIVFLLLITTYLYVDNSNLLPIIILRFSVTLFLIFSIWRIFLHTIFRKYRVITGSNYKKVIIIGSSEATRELQDFFNRELGFGYKFMGYFSDNNESSKLGSIKQSYDYILENKIDEVYCSVKGLSNKEIKYFIDFCDINIINLKFIPDNKELFSKNLRLNYYDITPILSLREIPLDDPINSVIKRVFDVLFSIFIIVFVLSWLIPILGLIIIIESKGPIFFQQDRPGIKERGFGCYKFRSMTLNSNSEDSATRNDARITRVGKFIRKTSIDELPQFFNVLFGEMSVVGPRPHLWRQNEIYGTKISKYMVRHFVKPGVTGLAQVRGYRGEIETKEDIVNRTKYDVFYIENWTLILDLGIIIQTVLNVFKGEEKAY